LHSRLFPDFPVFRQDTAPDPAGYRYDQANTETEGRKYSHQKHYQPHQADKADVSDLGIFRHLAAFCYFMLPILQVNANPIMLGVFLAQEKTPKPAKKMPDLGVMATITVQLRTTGAPGLF
jgi:hypothetical protein